MINSIAMDLKQSAKVSFMVGCIVAANQIVGPSSVLWLTVLEFTVTAIIYVVGFLFSRAVNDWTWFARAGALASALVLYVVILRAKVRMTSTFKNQANQAGDDDPVVAVLATFVEPFLLLIGTLVWGFGDLVGRLFR